MLARVELNPGLSRAVWIAFDVPEGPGISQYVLVLHGSPDSVGVPAWSPMMEQLVIDFGKVHGSGFEAVESGAISTAGL